MSTAQVSIELVLAGILALCAFVLPFFTGTKIDNALLADNIWIAVVALSYLLGVVFDKLADTLLTPFENFLRLRQADKYLKSNPNFKKDPFPQNKLEFRLREEKNGRLEWMESLKSRIRTSRELAVLGLPATTGIAIYIGLANLKVSASIHWVHIFIVLNLVLFIASALLDSSKADEDASPKPSDASFRTNQLDRDPDTRKKEMNRVWIQMHKDALVYYLLLVNSIIGIAAIALQNPSSYTLLALGIGGTVITLLALWACLRITRTYLKFVAREMDEYVLEKKTK
jgi:hypothetical protein